MSISIVPSASQPATRLSTGWKHILLMAFLSFGVAVPYASATCGGKNLEHRANTPASIESAQPALPVGTIPQLGPLPSIVGLWNVTFTSGGEVVDVAFDVWHADQTEVLNDYTPPAEGNVCLGVWRQTGTHSYKLKHPSWSFDANGNLLGTVVIGETINLSADGYSYTGSYTYTIYDVSGDFIEEFTGTIKATRINAG